MRDLDRIYASHPDHLATGEATLCAVYPDARNPFAFPELFEEALEPWAVDEVWVQGGRGTGTHAVDVTDRSTARSRALMCHVSQHTDPLRTETHGPRVDGQHGQAVRPCRWRARPRRSVSSTPVNLPVHNTDSRSQ